MYLIKATDRDFSNHGTKIGYVNNQKLAERITKEASNFLLNGDVWMTFDVVPLNHRETRKIKKTLPELVCAKQLFHLSRELDIKVQNRTLASATKGLDSAYKTASSIQHRHANNDVKLDSPKHYMLIFQSLEKMKHIYNKVNLKHKRKSSSNAKV